MVNKLNRTDKISFFLLKVMYYYAQSLGILLFGISIDDKPHLKTSNRMRFLSIGCRTCCLVLYITYLPAELKKLSEVPRTTQSSPMDYYAPVIFAFQFIPIVIFSLSIITFQAVFDVQLVKVLDRGLAIIGRIMKLRNSQPIITADFCLMILFRVSINLFVIIANALDFYYDIVRKKYTYIIQWLCVTYLWVGTLISLDVCIFCYQAITGMYRHLTDVMIEFEARLEAEYLQDVCKRQPRQRRLLRTFCDHLEECTVIYAEIYKIFHDFHGLLQFNIFFVFYIDFITVIFIFHLCIWMYLIKGELSIYFFFMGGIKTIDILTLLFTADAMVRTSRIPQYLNWDTLRSDLDKRWNRAVDQFLNISRFQDLKIEVFGLFKMDNELLLKFLSVIVTYLTLLSQFALLGYFQEDNYYEIVQYSQE